MNSHSKKIEKVFIVSISAPDSFSDEINKSNITTLSNYEVVENVISVCKKELKNCSDDDIPVETLNLKSYLELGEESKNIKNLFVFLVTPNFVNDFVIHRILKKIVKKVNIICLLEDCSKYCNNDYTQEFFRILKRNQEYLEYL